MREADLPEAYAEQEPDLDVAELMEDQEDDEDEETVVDHLNNVTTATPGETYKLWLAAAALEASAEMPWYHPYRKLWLLADAEQQARWALASRRDAEDEDPWVMDAWLRLIRAISLLVVVAAFSWALGFALGVAW